MTVGYLYDLCDSLLTALQAGTLIGVTGNETPTRVYVSHGLPVHDLGQGGGNCNGSQLVVWHGPVIARQVDPYNPCAYEWRTTLYGELARCVPTFEEDGDPPPAADLDTSAETLAKDMWALLWALDGWVKDQGCGSFTIGNGEVIGPSGGIAANRVAVTVGLNDSGP